MSSGSLLAEESKLFQPIKVGNLTLNHRIVLPPLTRNRQTKTHVPLIPLVAEYYAQRASTPGTLLIAEATFIAAQAGGLDHYPGIWNQEQISAWKDVTTSSYSLSSKYAKDSSQVTTAVHAKGCYIFLQIQALGGAASIDVLSSESPPFPYVAASAVSQGYPGIPRPLTTEEISEYVQLFATAASNAVEGAGFDGVEIHGANGYLVDQFLQDVTNQRDDKYGGSIENRVRFGLEVVDAVVHAVGAEKVGIRLSPWSRYNSKYLLFLNYR